MLLGRCCRPHRGCKAKRGRAWTASKVSIRLSGHPWWKTHTGPLLVFLATPQSWEQIWAWAHERGHNGHLVRHMVAWLELRRRVTWDGFRWEAVKRYEPRRFDDDTDEDSGEGAAAAGADTEP